MLYLGAFLIVIAALILLNASGDSFGDQARMALLVLGTLLFLGAGLICLRIPKVNQAGVVFFAVGAVMVPIDFVGAYVFFLEPDAIDPTGLWLAGSLTSAGFYGAVSFLRIGRWYPVPLTAALLSALAATLDLAGAPYESYPVIFIAAGFPLAVPAVRDLGSASEVLGRVWGTAARALVVVSVAVALLITIEEGPEGALAASLAGMLFFGALADLGMRDDVPTSAYAMLAAIGAFISLGLSLAIADVPPTAYPASYVGLALLLALPSMINVNRVSDAFGQTGRDVPDIAVPVAFAVSLLMIDSEGFSGALAASLAGAVFYAAKSFASNGPWPSPLKAHYPLGLAIGLLSSLACSLLIADVPYDAYPASFVGMALLFAGASFIPVRRVNEVLGLVGLAVANAIVPMAFVAALMLIDQGGTGNGVLAVSLAAAIVYLALSFGHLDERLTLPRELYPAGFCAAVLASLGFALLIGDAPEEAYPGSYIALGLVMAVPSVWRLGRVTELFGLPGSMAAHAVVAPALVAALALTVVEPEHIDIATRWYLPITAGAGVVFYWSQAFLTIPYRRYRDALAIAALATSGGAAITLVYALGVGEEWYGPAVAIVAWIYAAGSERFGPRWFGQRHLGWMALGAITFSWLAFEALYVDFPRQGAGVHFSAAILYVAAARIATVSMPLRLGAAGEEGEGTVDVSLRALLIYAAGTTICLGFLHLLASLPAAEDAGASEASMAFFWLSLGLAGVAATLRILWPEVRLHAYVVAAGVALFVLLSSLGAEGQITAQLGVYTGLTLAVALWERQPLALAVPGPLGVFCVIAAWRFYEPDDVYLPLVFSAVAVALFVLYAALRERREGWATTLLANATAYAVIAPIAGWARLSQLADPDGFVGGRSFEEAGLYQSSAAAVLVLSLLVASQARILRRIDIAAAATPLMMVALLLQIGHYRPENIQAYTAPLGVYLSVGASLALRVRSQLAGLETLIEPVQALGAVLLMGPGLIQSFDSDGWPYALLLLVEALLLLGVAVVQRWLWLLSTSIGFVVLDSLQYLVSAGEQLPTWAIVATAGILVMTAGFGILLGRERWSAWQQSIRSWWAREPLSA